jgi:hypothetical protein
MPISSRLKCASSLHNPVNNGGSFALRPLQKQPQFSPSAHGINHLIANHFDCKAKIAPILATHDRAGMKIFH